jgi:hypothetical protein
MKHKRQNPPINASKLQAVGVEEESSPSRIARIVIRLVIQLKLRIKITKGQHYRISSRFKLSFPIDAPNIKFKYDRIILSILFSYPMHQTGLK